MESESHCVGREELQAGTQSSLEARSSHRGGANVCREKGYLQIEVDVEVAVHHNLPPAVRRACAPQPNPADRTIYRTTQPQRNSVCTLSFRPGFLLMQRWFSIYKRYPFDAGYSPLSYSYSGNPGVNVASRREGQVRISDCATYNPYKHTHPSL